MGKQKRTKTLLQQLRERLQSAGPAGVTIEELYAEFCPPYSSKSISSQLTNLCQVHIIKKTFYKMSKQRNPLFRFTLLK